MPVIVDYDRPLNELIVWSSQGRIDEHGSAYHRRPIGLVYVTEHMQRRSNPADGSEQVCTSLIPVAAAAIIEDPQGWTVGNHQICAFRDS